MQWQDQGIILSARAMGERSFLVSLLTRAHGRHAGYLTVGQKRGKATLQAGNLVEAHWTARLAEQLGRWKLEVTEMPVARLMTNPLALTMLSSACQITDMCLAERHPYHGAYDALESLIADLSNPEHTLTSYIHYELNLLSSQGFGFDLSCCAATGVEEGLVYLSPKSGCAVSEAAGRPYHDKMLSLPPWLLHQEGAISEIEAKQILVIMQHFFRKHLLADTSKDLPPIRLRLLEMLSNTCENTRKTAG